MRRSEGDGHRSEWTFLTSHARVLVMLARDPTARLRDVAVACDVTERTVQAVVADLEEAGYLVRIREGRRNRYEVAADGRFRHSAEAGQEIAGLLDLLAPGSGWRGHMIGGEPRSARPVP